MARPSFMLLLGLGLVTTLRADDSKSPAQHDESARRLTTTAPSSPRAISDPRIKGIDWDRFGLEREFCGFDSRIVGDIAISADGRALMASCGAGDLAHWDIETGRLLGSCRCKCWRLAFAPGGDRAVVGMPDGAALVRLGSGDLIDSRPFGERYPKSLVVATPNIEQFAFGLPTDTAIVWDPKNKTTVRWQAPERTEIKGLAFSHDGASMFAHSETSVRQFDAKSGRDIRQFEAPEGKVQAMTVSSDAKLLAVTLQPDRPGAFSYAVVFDTATGKIEHEARCRSFPLGVHDARGFAFTPDGAALLFHVRSSRGAILRWDLRASELTLLRLIQDYHRWIVYSPDRRYFFTHCENETRDGVIRMWQVDPWFEALQKQP